MLLFDRNLSIQSKKELKTDLAAKYAKLEMEGGADGRKTIESSIAPQITAVASPGLEELVSLQSQGFSPIIIIPAVSSSKARLTALNAVKFLIEGVFEEPNAKQMQRPQSMPIEIEHKIWNQVFKIRIFDETTKFRKNDWKSIVAVFSDGKMWQFSGWPFRNEADLFHTIPVFHLRYVDDPPAMAGRVKSLKLKRGTRHEDAAVMIEFWKLVDSAVGDKRVKKFSNSQKLP